jgi:UDP-N-acetylglucosamine 2-epimerase (non-hydrolysing)
MKAAPVLRGLGHLGETKQTLVHTGQHYDTNISDVFFSQLEMPQPDVNLGVGSGSHARQTAEIMTRFEPVLLERRPDFVLVYGDVNSTIAAALVAAKSGIRVGHVEARSAFFRLEHARRDQPGGHRPTCRSSFYAFPGCGREPWAWRHSATQDSPGVVRLLPVAEKVARNRFPERYALVTVNRPSNVDDNESLKKILQSLVEISESLDVVFPMHPRTRQRIGEFGRSAGKLHLSEPLPYTEFWRCRAALR